MSLSGAAAAMGLPEDLVQRSAAARAAETGATVDEILAAWAGGETVQASPPGGEDVAVADATAAPADDATTVAEEETTEAHEPTEEAPPTPVIETPDAPAPAAAATPSRAPIPAEVTAAEAAHLPEVITVPTAGIRERTNFVIPRWLIALMLVAPLFALFALGGSSTGACGEATELGVDVISGDIVNCDGTEFTGGGAGGGGTDFIALGGEIYGGPPGNCAGCHGANGQGSGAFPALTGVLTTFGACEDHELWVTLGSSGWQEQVGPNYGDTNKPVGGGMPAFGGSLTEEQIAAVAAFERVRFGGATPDEALVDCGLVEDEGGEDGEAPADGEAPVDGEAPADGGEAPTETPAEGGDAAAGAGL
jgi:hypothetical protein